MKQKRFEQKPERIPVRVEPETKRWIENRAAITQRSENAVVDEILTEYIRQHEQVEPDNGD